MVRAATRPAFASNAGYACCDSTTRMFGESFEAFTRTREDIRSYPCAHTGDTYWFGDLHNRKMLRDEIKRRENLNHSFTIFV